MSNLSICIIGYEIPSSLSESIVSGEIKNPYSLIRGLADRGHRITIFSIPYLTKTVAKLGWRTKCDIPTYDVPDGLGRGVIRYVNRIRSAINTIAPILLQSKFDVIHAQTPGLGVAAQRACARSNIILPIVTTGHGTNLPEADADGAFTLRQRLRRVNARLDLFVDRAGYSASAATVSVSDFQREEMMKLYKVPAEKLHVIHNGVDLKRYTPDRERAELKALAVDSGPVILFVGRLVPKKGVSTLLHSFSRILLIYPKAKCIIVGGSPIFDTCGHILRDKADKLGLTEQVVWLQSVPEYQLPSVYRLADVCVFPSENYESLPTVILEAMATGVPVVATGRWGTPEALGLDHPGLVPESDIDAVTNAISKYLASAELRETVINTQLRRVRKFDIESTVSLHESLYYDVIEK